jgi:hypothetical protein
MAAGDIIVVKGSPSGKKGNFFDGNDDYCLHDNHAVARVAANDTVGTYSAWIFLDATGADSCILSAGDNDADTEYFFFYVSSTNYLTVGLNHAGAAQFRVRTTDNTNIKARTWHHVVCTQNGTQPALYIDGVAVATTNPTATDLTYWYDELTGCDKFAIGVRESNNTHTLDFKGAIGQVKYWNKALTAAEVALDYNGEALDDDGTYLQFNVTMADDGTTDSGLGADNGTLTGQAHYGGVISQLSYLVEPHVTGHAAETINIIANSPTEWTAIIKRGD